MANRWGSKQYVVLVPETEYGTAVTALTTTGTAMFDVTCEMKNDPIITDTKIKTGSTAPHVDEKVITGTNATVTIKGNLCSEYDELLTAFTHDTATAFVLGETSVAVVSYDIYAMQEVGAAEATNPYDLAVGCVCTDLKITGEANGIVQFESTWRCKSMDRGITTAVTAEPTAYAAGTPFIYGNTTGTLANTKTTFNSFAINLSKTLAEDRFSYQNSLTRVAEYIVAFNGTVDFETIYDDTTAKDPTFEGNIGVQTALTNLITLVNGAFTWAITTSGNVTSFDKADPDKGLFVAKYTVALAGDTDAAALSIVVAAV